MWHASFPFVVHRRKPFWLAATVRALDGTVLASGGRLVTAHANAASSFAVALLGAPEADVGINPIGTLEKLLLNMIGNLV